MPRGIICPECNCDMTVYYTRQVNGGTDRDYECVPCNVLADTEERVICYRHRDGTGVDNRHRERSLFDIVPDMEYLASVQ